MKHKTKPDLHECLRDPRRFEREIERLHKKHLLTRTLYELEQDKVTLARVIQRRSKVAKILARSVSRGSTPSRSAPRALSASSRSTVTTCAPWTGW